MKNILKYIVIVLLSIILIYTLFIIEESVRLKMNVDSKPLIILGRTKLCLSCTEVGEETTIEYFGIGYKLNVRYYHSEESSNDNHIYKIVGEELLLFNKIRLWAWIS